MGAYAVWLLLVRLQCACICVCQCLHYHQTLFFNLRSCIQKNLQKNRQLYFLQKESIEKWTLLNFVYSVIHYKETKKQICFPEKKDKFPQPISANKTSQSTGVVPCSNIFACSTVQVSLRQYSSDKNLCWRTEQRITNS